LFFSQERSVTLAHQDDQEPGVLLVTLASAAMLDQLVSLDQMEMLVVQEYRVHLAPLGRQGSKVGNNSHSTCLQH